MIAMHRTVRETNVIVLVPADANRLAREAARPDASPSMVSHACDGQGKGRAGKAFGLVQSPPSAPPGARRHAVLRVGFAGAPSAAG